MPNSSGRSWFRRAGSELVDRLFLANRGHDFESGYWDRQGAIQGGISGVLGTINPLLGFAANKGIDAYNRNQSQSIGREQFPTDTSLDMGDWGNPQVSVGRPQTVQIGGGMPNVPTMPNVTSQGPWQGLGTSTGNVFQGGALGNWANGGGAPQGLHYGNGAGAGTGYGASSYTNDAWGQTALGFGVGSSAGGSGGGIALSDAQKAQRMNADGRGFAWRGGG